MDVLETLTEFIRANRAAIVLAARREGLGPEDAVECAQEALTKHLQLIRRGGGHAPAEASEWLAVRHHDREEYGAESAPAS